MNALIENAHFCFCPFQARQKDVSFDFHKSSEKTTKTWLRPHIRTKKSKSKCVISFRSKGKTPVDYLSLRLIMRRTCRVAVVSRRASMQERYFVGKQNSVTTGILHNMLPSIFRNGKGLIVDWFLEKTMASDAVWRELLSKLSAMKSRHQLDQFVYESFHLGSFLGGQKNTISCSTVLLHQYGASGLTESQYTKF